MAVNAEVSRDVFEKLPVPRALAVMAFPTIISQLIILIYNVADTFYIGRTNNPMMIAGVSLILPLFNLLIAFASLTGTGGGTLVSRLLGMGKDDEARRVSSFSFCLGLLLAVLYSCFICVFMTPLLRMLGASAGTLLYASQYAFWVIVVGGVPTIFSMVMANMLRSVGCSKQAGFGVSAGGLLNIVLDPIFMFVIMPRELEVVGAGIATMLSNVFICSYFLFVIRGMRGRTVLTFDPSYARPSRQSVRSVFAVGIPAVMTMLMFDLAQVNINKLSSMYGDIPLAAIGIVMKTERLPLNVGIGICQGMIPLAAYSYAAGNFTRLREIVRCSRLAGLSFAVLSVVLYYVFAPEIMHIFIDDAETVSIGTRFLHARCVAAPLMFTCFHIVFLFQGMGQGGKSFILAALRWIVFNIPIMHLLNAVFGMYGIVWTQLVGDIFTVSVSLWMLNRFSRTALSRASEPQGGTAS